MHVMAAREASKVFMHAWLYGGNDHDNNVDNDSDVDNIDTMIIIVLLISITRPLGAMGRSEIGARTIGDS